MQTYLVTAFDNNSFRYGISWIASLKELAKYDGKIVVIGFNLTSRNKDIILATGVQLIEEEACDDFKKIIFNHILEIGSKENAVIAYWDPVVYFQKDISEVLNLAENNLIACVPGFLAGSSKCWQLIKDLNKIFSFLNLNEEYDQVLLRHFSGLVQEVDSCWNFSELGKLKDKSGILCFRDQPVNVIHVRNEIEKFVSARNILFWERHKRIFQKYTKFKSHNTFKLLVGHQTISSINKNI